MESLNRRTEGNSGVGYQYDGSVLAVGARTAVIDDVFDRSQVLHTYFDLVADQRSGPLAARGDLRDRDLVSLATILDLPALELERYIDRELGRFVANTAADARAAARDALRNRIFFTVFGSVALAAAVAIAIANVV